MSSRRPIPGEVQIEEIPFIGLLNILLKGLEKDLKTNLSDDKRTDCLAKKERILLQLERLAKTNLKSAK